MPKVMEIIEKETKGKSYHTYKYSYDSIGLPSIDYDDDPNKVMKWKDSGETDSPKGAVDLKHLADQLQQLGERPLLKYFLDGSRHVFKVDDIAYNKQVFPVVAGQIGVGCCRRENKRMQKERFYRELVLALPDKANADGWDDAAYFAAKVKKLNESEELMRLGLHFSAILPYATSKAGSPGTKLENLAVGVIQDYMVEAEKRMVAELVRDKRLGQDAYLLKDGSLEYKIMKSGREDLRTLQKIKHNYSWVIGVSKSFNPESCLDHTGKPNSNYIANLPVFHRTPVARYENREFLGDVQFGVWYIRLRDKRRTQTPFDGVVKVEKIMLSENKKRMVVAICAEEEISSIEWARLKKDKWVNRSISCPEYVQRIYKMMNWNKDCRYKVYGRLANSERGLVLVFDLASAVMFDPLPEEYFDKHTGKMKKRIVKYYPDEIRMKLGRSYSDYEALQQRSSFESLSGYMDTSGGAVPATVSEELAASISMQEQEKKRETLFGTIIGNGGDDDVRNNE